MNTNAGPRSPIDHAADLVDWLASPRATDAAAANRAAVVHGSTGSDEVSFVEMMSALPGLPYFLIGKGIQQIRNGDEDGWQTIRESLECMRLWLLSTRAFVRAKGNKFGGGSIGLTWFRFAHSALLATAVAEDSVSEWFAQECVRMSEDGTAVASSIDDQFPEFMLTYSRLWLGEKSASDRASSSNALVAALSESGNADHAQGSMAKLIEYHVWRCDSRPDSDNPDNGYHQPGLALLPTPVVAIRALRARDGRPIAGEGDVLAPSLAADRPTLGLKALDPLFVGVETRIAKVEQRGFRSFRFW